MNLCQPIHRPCFVCGASLPGAGVSARDCAHFEPVHFEQTGGPCLNLLLGSGICQSDAARAAVALDRRYQAANDA